MVELQSPQPYGSSPHTRGAREDGARAAHLARIIPAYAGSTASTSRTRRGSPDHPRIRGEHTSDRSNCLLDRGSSPHTRGALDRYGITCPIARIIPAYAGSTDVVVSLVEVGEGSSPHTRGAPLRYARATFGERIIPAYAGSTGLRLHDVRLVQDHPRIRGEH